MAARFYTLATDVAPKPYRTHQGPGVVSVATVTTNNPTSLPATMIPVGLTENDIEINPNVETSPVNSAQMFNPYNMVETAWAWQMTFSVDHIDPFTLALSFSFDISDTVTAGSVVSLTGQCPSPFRGVKIDIEGPTDTGSLVKQTMSFEFYKAKLVSNGGLPISPESKSTLPVICHGLGNDSDIVGRLITTEAITDPGLALAA